jgi:hypothetical protein
MSGLNFSEACFDRIKEEWLEQIMPIESSKFCDDGIIDIAEWIMAKPKIMFLLKESYSVIDKSGKDKSYKNIRNNAIKVRNGKGSHFFPNILLRKHLIDILYNDSRETNKGKTIPYLDYTELPEWESNSLNSIAYFNVKKVLGKSSSTYTNIRNFAKKYSTLLKKHIDAIDPNVIFCDGTTYMAYRDIYHDEKGKIEKINTGVTELPKFYKHKNRLIIFFYHPSFHGESHKELFERLEQGMKAEYFDLFNW